MTNLMNQWIGSEISAEGVKNKNILTHELELNKDINLNINIQLLPYESLSSLKTSSDPFKEQLHRMKISQIHINFTQTQIACSIDKMQTRAHTFQLKKNSN